MLHELIDNYVTIASNAYNQRADGNILLVKELGELLAQRVRLHGCILSQNKIHDLLSMDVNLNAEGLKCWLELNNK